MFVDRPGSAPEFVPPGRYVVLIFRPAHIDPKKCCSHQAHWFNIPSRRDGGCAPGMPGYQYAVLPGRGRFREMFVAPVKTRI